jgi:hypothetical protein
VDFAFLKQRYDYELERMDRLTNAVSQSAGFLALLGGVITVMARGFSYDETWLTIAFLVPLLVGVGAAAFSVCHLAVAYYHQAYLYLPDLSALVKEQDEMLRLRMLRAITEAEAKEQFMLRLGNLVVELSDQNGAVNGVRVFALKRANRALLLVLVLTSIAGLSYVVDQGRSTFMARQRIVLTDPPDVSEEPRKFPEAVVDDGRKPWVSRLPKGVRLNIPWYYRWWYGDPPIPKDDEPG